MGESMERGMVLVMSLWDDHAANMLWLDSSYPPTKDPSAPGVTRGSCSPDSGKPSDVESQHPNSGIGKYGTCCAEFDTWEGNSISTAYTAHPCTVKGQTRC